MKVLTRQEAFDAALLGIRKQGKPSHGKSAHGDFMCRYNSGGDGQPRHCAHWFVADAAGVAEQLVEMNFASALDNGSAAAGSCIEKGPDGNSSSWFGDRIQSSHDRAARKNAEDGDDFMPEFERRMRNVANEFGLNYTAPEGA